MGPVSSSLETWILGEVHGVGDGGDRLRKHLESGKRQVHCCPEAKAAKCFI